MKRKSLRHVITFLDLIGFVKQKSILVFIFLVWSLLNQLGEQ
tara:strand:- start:1 stop:126 length:126 start_codon:yes stop_codon:yes gene_type:complete